MQPPTSEMYLCFVLYMEKKEGVKGLSLLLVQGAVKRLTIDRAIVHFLPISVQNIDSRPHCRENHREENSILKSQGFWFLDFTCYLGKRTLAEWHFLRGVTAGYSCSLICPGQNGLPVDRSDILHSWQESKSSLQGVISLRTHIRYPLKINPNKQRLKFCIFNKHPRRFFHALQFENHCPRLFLPLR